MRKFPFWSKSALQCSYSLEYNRSDYKVRPELLLFRNFPTKNHSVYKKKWKTLHSSIFKKSWMLNSFENIFDWNKFYNGCGQGHFQYPIEFKMKITYTFFIRTNIIIYTFIYSNWNINFSCPFFITILWIILKHFYVFRF